MRKNKKIHSENAAHNTAFQSMHQKNRAAGQQNTDSDPESNTRINNGCEASSCIIPEKKHKMTLVLAFSLLIFIILFLTISTSGLIIYGMIHFGFITVNTVFQVLNPVLLLGIISLVIGSFLTMIGTKLATKNVNNIISAIEELAHGNFETRLYLGHPAEFDRLSRSFNHMAEELQNTEILRNDFVNNFSHEFKTPIVSMRGYAKMLKHSDLTPEERDEYLDIIISESDRLAGLSTNVLNLTKYENQGIVSNQKVYNVTEQIRLAIAVSAQKWYKKNPSFDMDGEEILVEADEAMLAEIWLNLLDNAIKFSPDDGEIRLSVRSDGGFLIFNIHDNGVGIDISNGDRIFDKFYQENQSHSTQGSGLGLSICKRIAELHGGSIRLVSGAVADAANANITNNPGGTEFEVRMPIISDYS